MIEDINKLKNKPVSKLASKSISRKLNTAEVVGLQAAFQTVKQCEVQHAQAIEQLNSVLRDLGIENFSLDKNYRLNEQNELVEV